MSCHPLVERRCLIGGAIVIALSSPGHAGPCGPVNITQSSDSTVILGNSWYCQPDENSLHLESHYYRAFDLVNDHSIFGDFSVCEVTIGIQFAVSGAAGTQPLEIRLYDTSDVLDLGEPVGSAIFDLEDQALSLANLPISGTATSGGLVVEVLTPSGQADGNVFIFGSNPQPQTGPSYLAAPDCDVPQPTDLAELDLRGFPDMHIVMVVTGTAACTADSNDDGFVDVNDLIAVIIDWNTDGSANGGDLTGDGTVDVNDLVRVIVEWGACPA